MVPMDKTGMWQVPNQRKEKDAGTTLSIRLSNDSKNLLLHFKCRQSAIFNSVISPAPEMRLISRSFFLIASAVAADELLVFGKTNCLLRIDDF